MDGRRNEPGGFRKVLVSRVETAQAESMDRAPVGEGRKKSPSPRKPSQFLKLQNKDGQNHPPDASDGWRVLGLWVFKERKRGRMLGWEVPLLS